MANNQTIIDSCVWVGLIAKNDTNNEKAFRQLLSLKDKKIKLYDFIYSETQTVLRKKLGINACKELLALLVKAQIKIETTSQDFYLIANNYFFKFNKLSFPDCLLLATAMKEKAELVSFDKNLMNAYRTLC